MDRLQEGFRSFGVPRIRDRGRLGRVLLGISEITLGAV